ncbi:hypothetical protein WJX72_002460 [[Myrmecia] bisecta]|uniref:Photosystem I subunit O n=1 Tax=[Myrmecia] bisecta TaxID=41462 RepID=A0AAW1R5J4_9CHLO
MATRAVVGLGAAPLAARPAKSGFLGARLAPVAAQRRSINSTRAVTRAAVGSDFPSNWLNKDPLVPVLGFLGWTIPANIPTGALGGNSLFGLFLGSIGENLSHFPIGPSLTDKFWLYLIVYHVGLFTTLLLGQVGVNGRKQGYFN